MSITSYAQNFEDVMLWRALSHVSNGFYIDIGAQDPTIDSVSLAFHQQGWRGVHIEPTPHYAELLRRQQRAGDIVIQAAIGNGAPIMSFYEIRNTGISTADKEIATQHQNRGFDVHEITVASMPLSAVFETCPQAEIHWLKIDVEGFEQQVLLSWGISAARPWIVVVESTLPLTQIETHQTWETTLISYGYTAVYFDGLNRYYISDAHPELQQAFKIPPNVFDGFALNGTASAPFHKLIENPRRKKHRCGASAIAAIPTKRQGRNCSTRPSIRNGKNAAIRTRTSTASTIQSTSAAATPAIRKQRTNPNRATIPNSTTTPTTRAPANRARTKYCRANAGNTTTSSTRKIGFNRRSTITKPAATTALCQARSRAIGASQCHSSQTRTMAATTNPARARHNRATHQRPTNCSPTANKPHRTAQKNQQHTLQLQSAAREQVLIERNQLSQQKNSRPTATPSAARTKHRRATPCRSAASRRRQTSTRRTISKPSAAVPCLVYGARSSA
ncbi:FkbM family methyltransferase [Deefgea sp. CFH1-16]|nr:FkbM family methyltransferase [Deefgea sp. CFH1-16]